MYRVPRQIVAWPRNAFISHFHKYYCCSSVFPISSLYFSFSIEYADWFRVCVMHIFSIEWITLPGTNSALITYTKVPVLLVDISDSIRSFIWFIFHSVSPNIQYNHRSNYPFRLTTNKHRSPKQFADMQISFHTFRNIVLMLHLQSPHFPKSCTVLYPILLSSLSLTVTQFSQWT